MTPNNDHLSKMQAGKRAGWRGVPQTARSKPSRAPHLPRPGQDIRQGTRRWAKGLGLASLGLGVAGILASRQITELIGLRRKHRPWVQAFGARELLTGAAILAAPVPHVGVLSRVAGDALNLTTLGAALRSPNVNKRRVSLALLAVAGVAFADVMVGRRLNRVTRGGEMRVRETLIINRPAAVLYQYWHNFENLPTFMEHVKSVTASSPRDSHWVVKAPAGTQVAWDAEITEDRPNKLIAWRSLEGARVPNHGRVAFEPATGERGTMVTVELHYEPPAGRLGATVAKLFGEEPSQQVKGDLRRFKQIMETGEVIRSDATLRGNKAFDQRPAAPLDEPPADQLPEAKPSTPKEPARVHAGGVA